MTKTKITRSFLCILLSFSMLFSLPAAAFWEVLLGGALGYIAGSASSSGSPRVNVSNNIDLSALRRDLQNGFASIVPELQAINQAIRESGQAAVNAQGFLMLPPGNQFSTGENVIKKEDLQAIITEMLDGKSDTAKRLRLDYKDIMIVLSLVDLKNYVLEAEHFSAAKEKLASLNEQDRIFSDDTHLSLLAALVAAARAHRLFTENKVEGRVVIDPVRDAADTYFPIVIQQNIQMILNESIDKMKWEERAHVLEALATDLAALPTSAPAEQKKDLAVTTLRERDLMLDFESLENVMLAGYQASSDMSSEHIAELDKMLSDALSSTFVSQLKLLDRSLEISQEKRDLEVKKIEQKIKTERDRIANRRAGTVEDISMMGQYILGGLGAGFSIAILMTSGFQDGVIEPIKMLFTGRGEFAHYYFGGVIASGFVSATVHQVTKRLRLRRNQTDSEAYIGSLQQRSEIEDDNQFISSILEQRQTVATSLERVTYLRLSGPTCAQIIE